MLLLLTKAELSRDNDHMALKILTVGMDLHKKAYSHRFQLRL